MGKMDKQEKMVYEYLLSQGYDEIQHEPNCQDNNCNIPPDFSIRGKIGIEVRRLNQHYSSNGKVEALETLEFSLIPKIRNLLASYIGCDYEKSSFVMIRYSRPIKASKHLIKELKKELDTHLPNIHLKKKFQIGNLVIELFPSSTRLGSAYCMGVEIDKNSGGFLVSNLYKNLELVIKEKHDKIKQERNKYDCWWLILVDYISYGLASYDLEQLNSLSPFNHCFDKILLLSPEDISHASEVKL